MIRYKYKKPMLWHGSVSVRSYVVDKALKEKESLIVEWDGKTMTIEPQKLLAGKWNKDVFRSKENPLQKYVLVDYEWKEDRKQLNLFS